MCSDKFGALRLIDSVPSTGEPAHKRQEGAIAQRQGQALGQRNPAPAEAQDSTRQLEQNDITMEDTPQNSNACEGYFKIYNGRGPVLFPQLKGETTVGVKRATVGVVAPDSL